MHVIEETDTFTLVGVDAKLGKLTLFDAEGPRERGSIEHIALRVGTSTRRSPGLPQAAARRSARTAAGALRGAGRPAARAGRARRVDFDLDHVLLRLPDREAALAELEGMGFERRDGGWR